MFHCHVLHAIFIVNVRFTEFHSLSNKVTYIALSWLTSLVYMQDYMKEQQLPSALKHRVLDFFEYLWVRNKGTDRQSLLSDMPYCMQAEVSLATTESLLRKVLLLILICMYSHPWAEYHPLYTWLPTRILLIAESKKFVSAIW